MGIVRLILAISVLLSHTSALWGIELIGGPLAVKSFYAISGFYMALVLNEKYNFKHRSYYKFISNRIFRIYPIYWTILCLSILISFLSYYYYGIEKSGRLNVYLQHGDNFNLITWIAYVGSQLVLFGQDILLFMGFNTETGKLFFTSNFKLSNPSTADFMFIPQAWTISIEMMFYMIAPCVAKINLKKIIVLTGIPLLINISLLLMNLNFDPWTYRFFPAELIYFFAGIIVYKLWRMKVVFFNNRKLSPFIFIIVLAFTFLYSFIIWDLKSYAYLIIFILSIPHLFQLTEKIKWDRYIGELSYPVYLSHILIITGVNLFSVQRIINYPFTILAITLILSVLLHEFIQKPIDRIRQKRLT